MIPFTVSSNARHVLRSPIDSANGFRYSWNGSVQLLPHSISLSFSVMASFSLDSITLPGFMSGCQILPLDMLPLAW